MKGFTLAIFILLYGSGLLAQEAITSSGGDGHGEGGTISFTVGQLASHTHVGISAIVSEGVQQAFEITEITGFEVEDIILDISAYPNPTTDRLILRTNIEFQDISFHLYDINGRVYETGNVIANESQIDMSHFDPAIYFLEIRKEGQKIKTFKIIKY